MSKKMTPCEKLGYKVGDKFKVVDGTGVHYAVGSFITLIHDDGSSRPRFNGVHAIFESGDSFFPLDFVEKVAKLKPAKQVLADAIHQNGGWRSGKYAVYGKQSGKCSFLTCKPKYQPKDHGWFVMLSWIVGEFEMKPFINWHQTILSREEYYLAYPKADADGWVEWSGVAKSPVGKGVAVDVKMKNGTQHFGQLIDDECWGDHWGDASIIAYRPHKPGVKHEFCKSVTRSIPGSESIDELCAKVTEENKHQHVDAKPTIEQLAQDYRNKIDCARRRLGKAEVASHAASYALSLLRSACKKFGLDVSPSVDAKDKLKSILKS